MFLDLVVQWVGIDMTDPLKIYWSPYYKCIDTFTELNDDLSFLRFHPPEPLAKHIDLQNFFGHASRCPAITDEVKSTYVIKSPLEFGVDIDYDKTVIRFKQELYGEEFCKNMIGAPTTDKVHQLKYPSYMFFCAESLLMTSMPAFYHRNSFTENVMVFAASYDINNWVRIIKPAFKFCKTSKFEIERDDILMYIKFNTNRPIKLIPFDSDNEEIRKIMEACVNYKMYKEKWYIPDRLEQCYEAFNNYNLKRKMLRLVENLSY